MKRLDERLLASIELQEASLNSGAPASDGCIPAREAAELDGAIAKLAEDRATVQEHARLGVVVADVANPRCLICDVEHTCSVLEELGRKYEVGTRWE